MTNGIGTMMTPKQHELIKLLQRQLHLSDVALNIYCQKEFNSYVVGINRRQASTLIETMKGWEAVPADLQRAMGQRELIGFSTEKTP